MYSFEEWCITNNRKDLLDRWDYDLNKLKPTEISYKSNKKYWFKCPIKIHDSELQNIQYFGAGKQTEMICKNVEVLLNIILINMDRKILINY